MSVAHGIVHFWIFSGVNMNVTGWGAEDLFEHQLCFQAVFQTPGKLSHKNLCISSKMQFNIPQIQWVTCSTFFSIWSWWVTHHCKHRNLHGWYLSVSVLVMLCPFSAGCPNSSPSLIQWLTWVLCYTGTQSFRVFFRSLHFGFGCFGLWQLHWNVQSTV